MAYNVNTDLIKGNDMFLFIALPDASGNTSSAATDAVVVAYATSCSMEINADTIDTTSKMSCRWNSVMQGNGSYTISADALYALQSNMTANSAYTIDDLFAAMVDGENVSWFMGQNSAECGSTPVLDSSKPYYWGTAAITSLSITAGNGEICSSSISMTGDGKPNQVNS